MSLAAEGTMFHAAGPARTAMARFLSFSMTVCFLPLMVQEPATASCATLTSGAPHSARGNFCAEICCGEGWTDCSRGESAAAVTAQTRRVTTPKHTRRKWAQYDIYLSSKCSVGPSKPKRRE